MSTADWLVSILSGVDACGEEDSVETSGVHSNVKWYFSEDRLNTIELASEKYSYVIIMNQHK